MRSSLLWIVGFLGLVSAGPAAALVHVDIDLSRQRMHVTSQEGNFDWPISSARSGFSTPGGSFAPTHLERMHYSRKYDMAPMPNAIFFRGGYAIHGTYATGSLGRPASHGCVRLSPGNAAHLYDMVRREGGRIAIHGTPPATRIYAGRRMPRAPRYPDEDYGEPVSGTSGYYSYAPGYIETPVPYPMYGAYGAY